MAKTRESGLICPICSAFTAYTPFYRRDRELLVYEDGLGLVASIPLEMPYSSPGMPGTKIILERYAIVQCKACLGSFIVHLDSMQGVYPIPHKVAPVEIPEPIKTQFEEAYLCFSVKAYMACVAMCQRTLESLCQHKTVSSLNELRDKGIISGALFDRATEIRLWAGLTKHKAIDGVIREDTEQLLAYLEMILHSVYVEPSRLDSLRNKRQQLDKK